MLAASLVLCFNGAATARSRMESRPGRSGGGTRCFNGAATARSRMAGSSRAWARAHAPLQWGRDR